MESLSRPPHRRKHSSSTNIFSSSVSFKNPYDGVLLSNGGERKSLEAHEYSEIFSGSSSIPVLDLPGLDERVGTADSGDSKLDYSNIFGGFTNDDVFVPYEELLNASAKKTKPRMPAESQPQPQESGSRNPSRKTKRSPGEASDHSVDGVKKQINISFNKTNQRNGDATEGKTHVAQLHAVPAFTHFIDGTPRPDKTKGSQVPLLKREVSRTWSFSAQMGPVLDKGGFNCGTSQTKDTLHNANEVNIKSQFTNMPPPSSCPSNLNGDKDPRQWSPSNFASKEDASQKMAGECSPPFFGEEFDENSVDAVSAAALKKAIEQAQESIRIAKMIMERKKDCCQDGSKPRSIGGLKVSNAEAKIDREAYVSKDNKAKGKHEKPDNIVNAIAGIDGKFAPSSSHSSTVSNAANSEVERVWEDVEANKEHGETFSGKSKLFVSTSSHSERLHINENVKLEKIEENVEATETQREAKDFPGSVANAVCGTVEVEPVKVRNINGLMTDKLEPDFGELGTEKEIFERTNLTVHHIERSEVIPGLVEWAADTSERTQGMEKIVDEDELCRATLDHAEGSENMVERVPSTFQRTTEHYMVKDEVCDNLSSSEERDVSKQRENDTNYKKKNGELEEFNNVLDESCNHVGNESLKQEKMKKSTENDSYEESSGTKQKEAHMKETLLEEINKREHHTAPEIGEFEKIGSEANKIEINDKKQDLADDDEDEAKLAEVLSQNKAEQEQVSICEYEADGTIMMEANLCAEVQKMGAFWDTNGTVNDLGGAGRSGGSPRKCEFQEAAYEEDIDEAVEVRSYDTSTIFDDAHTQDNSTINNETKEACNADLNSKEHWRTAKNHEEDEIMPEVNETVSAIDQEKKAEQLFHLHDNEILGSKSLHRSASEEIFVDNKLEKAFEALTSAGKMETVGVVDADPEENLLKDENVSNTIGDIHDVAQEYATEINRQNLPEELACDIRMADLNFTDVRQVLEQTSESDEGSLSVSSSEKIEGLPADESDEFTENAKDLTSEKEESVDQPNTISDERKCAEDLSEFSGSHSEPKEMDKPKNSDRDEEKGLNPKTKKENLAGASPTDERDAKDSEQHSESNDQKQRIEAIKRGREREKDRLVVERAIREARERAFADARERAERAAVEKAAAEARQRIMAEAKGKVEKSNTEAKLRAERAAVERATVEARERALEKAMSQKVSTERVSSSSRNSGLKHSFSSSDLENGMNTESAQRRKARLERHQRIMERAAKALAEKNMRDLLVQKEQAERNRLAESLDADIKRWASGKEGNLRALLSTLQYILGPDSGWQPISLTEIITTVAVKKAYRKATLYVHPDKLQQRGASVQQKYVCEKVFDLLKAAWNRFNSDER